MYGEVREPSSVLSIDCFSKVLGYFLQLNNLRHLQLKILNLECFANFFPYVFFKKFSNLCESCDLPHHFALMIWNRCKKLHRRWIASHTSTVFWLRFKVVFIYQCDVKPKEHIHNLFFEMSSVAKDV